MAFFTASSRKSEPLGAVTGGNGREHSYGKSGVGCHATNTLLSFVVTTFSTSGHAPVAVLVAYPRANSGHLPDFIKFKGLSFSAAIAEMCCFQTKCQSKMWTNDRLE